MDSTLPCFQLLPSLSPGENDMSELPGGHRAVRGKDGTHSPITSKASLQPSFFQRSFLAGKWGLDEKSNHKELILEKNLGLDF